MLLLNVLADPLKVERNREEPIATQELLVLV